MADVFISYAGEDQLFVRSLFAALEERKRDAWVDWKGIPPTAEWVMEVAAAIDAADTFVFVMSPDPLASEVCGREVDHAVRRNNRMVPVVRRETKGRAIPESLAKFNWIFLCEQVDFAGGVDALIEALDTDLDHVRLHTRYLKRAIDWGIRTSTEATRLAAAIWRQPRPGSRRAAARSRGRPRSTIATSLKVAK